MDVLYIGSLYSENRLETYIKNSKRGFQYASQNLQESLLDGFIQNEVKLTVLTVPSLSTFPRSYSKMYVPNNEFIYQNSILGISVGFLNIPFLRIPFTSPDKYVEKWYNTSGRDKHIFVYGMHSNLMKIAIRAKQKYPEIKLTLIIPDLPQYFGWNKYYKLLHIDSRRIKSSYDYSHHFDKLVVLSKYMLDYLCPTDNVKSIVMEGIFTPPSVMDEISKDEVKGILYSGNVSDRYGLSKLVESFRYMNDDYELWIRGNGTWHDDLLSKINQDKRIRIIPPLSKSDLIALQHKASLLVNPVPSKEEFTKYFFPSKTMDYLASGTPVIMFDLKCLPEEYKTHLFFFSNDNPETMASDMKRVCELSKEKLKTIGENSKNFIFKEKNAKVQVKKIIDLMQK